MMLILQLAIALHYQQVLQFKWSDVCDGLRLRPHNTIIPPQNKNILV
ncbi:hypothetical protein [Nostoc sp. DSM 114161]